MSLRRLALGLATAPYAVFRGVRCGNDDKSPEFRPSEGDSPLRQLFPAPPPVNLTVHIVAASPSRDDGYLSEAEVDNQVQIIKDAYKSTGITFNHTKAHNRWVVNPNWAGRQVGSFFNEMKEALHVGNYRNLNLYFRNITAIDYGGICTNPEQQITAEKDPEKRLLRDGCVIAIFSLPGNEHEYMNQGKTVVHEMGHWFGLYHPFHDNGLRENNENPNPCNPTNPDDHVLDTPKMRYTEDMIGTCNMTLNSCANDNGTDPVRNYMSYSSDACMDEFSPGQVARMYEIYAKYRQEA